MENKEKNVHIGGIFNYFEGATINNLVINGNMTKSGTEQYYNNGSRKNTTNVTREDQAQALEPCRNDTEVTDDDQRFKMCIDILMKEKLLKNLYDYTWVMEASNQTESLPNFNTPSSFITYLKSIGIERTPSEDTINRKQNVFAGSFPLWEFTDCDTTEANRRICVGKRFVNAYKR